MVVQDCSSPTSREGLLLQAQPFERTSLRLAIISYIICVQQATYQNTRICIVRRGCEYCNIREGRERSWLRSCQSSSEEKSYKGQRLKTHCCRNRYRSSAENRRTPLDLYLLAHYRSEKNRGRSYLCYVNLGTEKLLSTPQTNS